MWKLSEDLLERAEGTNHASVWGTSRPGRRLKSPDLGISLVQATSRSQEDWRGDREGNWEEMRQRATRKGQVTGALQAIKMTFAFSQSGMGAIGSF